MFDRLFLSCYDFVQRHKTVVLGLILLATLVFGATLSSLRFEGRIDQMLPPDPEIIRSLDFLRESNLSDKVIVSLALTDPSQSRRYLIQAVDQVASNLQPPLFTKVVTGVNVADAMDEFSMLRYAPQILGPEDLERINRMLTPEIVADKLGAIYRQALRPESVLMSSLSRLDPLGIKLLFLDKLKALPSSMGYNVTVEDEHFLSSDGRHALMIIETPAPMMDSQQSREMIEALRQSLSVLPDGVTADIICGHLHTIGNEAAIKHDILLASVIASVAFILLFVIWFRDPRVLYVFIIPLIAVLWSITIASGVYDRLLFLVIGFGTAIAGISIDFGLHIYIGLTRGAKTDRIQKLARLLTINALTTVCGFAVLYFSQVHGYRQLAFFSILCVGFCVLLALFVLPVVLKQKTEHTIAKPPRDLFENPGSRQTDRLWIGTWLVVTLLAVVGSFSARFESDLKQLDGSGADVIATEERFFKTWGGESSQALLVVSGESVESAMELNDRVYAQVMTTGIAEPFNSLAQFWPSDKVRRKNAEQWDRFWKDGSAEKLEALIAEAAHRYGFSDDAFAPFFDGLEQRHSALSAGAMISQLRERFLVENEKGVSVLSFFPDEEETITALKSIVDGHPNIFIVSRKALSTSISVFTATELRVLVPLAILVNVTLTWIFFRGWRQMLIALTPVTTAMICLAGLMALFGLSLNVVNLVAAIVATGVIVDYGLGMTYEHIHDLQIGTGRAVTLSAVTSIIGSGALLFAHHPALYSTGVAMVISMLVGYLTAVGVVPSLCRVCGLSNKHRGVS